MEIRSITELGAPKLSEGRIIEGYAVVFGKESRVMYDEERKRFFIEVIEHGAATEELITRCDIKAVLEHDKHRLLITIPDGIEGNAVTVPGHSN